MSRLATPPRFGLPRVEAGQNDRELVYTTDPTSVIRSPFMPQLTEFNALSDASPAPALSPMNPTATLPGGNTAVDPKVLSGESEPRIPEHYLSTNTFTAAIENSY